MVSELSEELANINAINILTPDFSGLRTYIVGSHAILTEKPANSKKKLLATQGFVLSLFVAVFIAMIYGGKQT